MTSYDEKQALIDSHHRDDENVSTSWLSVNTKFLPVKLFYFIYISSTAAVQPYLPLCLFEMGLNTFQVGIIRCIGPVTSFTASPMWGLLSDKYQAHRVIMILCALLSSLSTPTLLLVPPVEYYGSSTFNGINRHNLNNSGRANHFQIQEGNISDDYLADFNGHVPSDIPAEGLPTEVTQELFPSVSIVTFSLLTVIVTISSTLLAGIIPLLDANTVELCKKYPGATYGGQRWPGALAVIVLSPFAGLLIDFYQNYEKRNITGVYFLSNSYTPSFLLFSVLMLLSVVPLLKVEVVSKRAPKSISKELITLFCDADVIMTFIVVFVAGVCRGIVDAFLFIFLGEIGASKTLMSLSLVLTCVTEVPCLIYAGKVIDILGNDIVFCLGLLAYVVRFGGYSFLHNPWMVLPIETLHGICYGLLWPNCTEYANGIAPEGMAATLQSIMHATKAGIGVK
ncbi:Major facilitator superfamily domain-containing protein 6 [Holothuria leucospilota]|uniref:Major facilitator superfamily domain-containing protein 6 n=1 Tax=Holothuria leucospilota TaxID=206669 RepID=A0A9Q1H9K5_HOLLE|nr:Major facilitator superfamily domain-containing protein 6 [Holothuria leucospilota]